MLERERGKGDVRAHRKLRELWSVTHTIPLSHLHLSLKYIVPWFSLKPLPPDSKTLAFLKVTSDTVWLMFYSQFHQIAHRDSIITAPLQPISLEYWLNNWSFHTLLNPLVVAYNSVLSLSVSAGKDFIVWGILLDMAINMKSLLLKQASRPPCLPMSAYFDVSVSK